MSIVSGYKKFKKYILTSSGFQLVSHWTNANTLQFDDGKTAQAKLGAIDGISSSKDSSSDKIAASTKLVSELNSNLTALNDSGAIKSMDAREDGVYITYVPTVGADTVTKKLGSGISFRWKYAGQPNIIRGTTQQISEIDVSNYTFATFAVYTNSANLDINILGNGATIISFKTGTQKLDINEYTSISANFAVKYNLPATMDITITLY